MHIVTKCKSPRHNARRGAIVVAALLIDRKITRGKWIIANRVMGRRARREGVAGNLRRRPFIRHADNGAVPNGVHARAGSAGRSASGVKAIWIRARRMPRGDAALHSGEEYPREAEAYPRLAATIVVAESL